MRPRINLHYKQLVSHGATLEVLHADIGLDLFLVSDKVPCIMSFSNICLLYSDCFLSCNSLDYIRTDWKDSYIASVVDVTESCNIIQHCSDVNDLLPSLSAT